MHGRARSQGEVPGVVEGMMASIPLTDQGPAWRTQPKDSELGQEFGPGSWAIGS